MNIKNAFFKPGKLTETFFKVSSQNLIYNRSNLFIWILKIKKPS